MILKKLMCLLFGHFYDTNIRRIKDRDSGETVAKICLRCGHTWWI